MRLAGPSTHPALGLRRKWLTGERGAALDVGDGSQQALRAGGGQSLGIEVPFAIEHAEDRLIGGREGTRAHVPITEQTTLGGPVRNDAQVVMAWIHRDTGVGRAHRVSFALKCLDEVTLSREQQAGEAGCTIVVDRDPDDLFHDEVQIGGSRGGLTATIEQSVKCWQALGHGSGLALAAPVVPGQV